MSKFYLPLFLFLSFLSQAQNSTYNIQNLGVSIDDLKATRYLKDSTANALVIYEEGSSEFDKRHDNDLVLNYGAKIKIFNKEGFDAANIEIPLHKTDDNKERIINLKAATYNLVDGKMTRLQLKPEAVYTKELEKVDLLRFTFPNVKPGSVLVYTYELVSPYFYNFTTWDFQGYIPKAFSKFSASIPGNYEYYTSLIGTLKLKTNDSRIKKRCISFSSSANPADCINTVYEMVDIPAFKDENFLTSEKNHLSRIKYELKQITRLDGSVHKFTKTWEDVDKELKTDKNIGRILKKHSKVQDLLPEEFMSMPNNLEKATKIYRFVQQEFTWNEEYQLFSDNDIKDIIDEKTGSVLEINTVLHNLYKSQGFNVLPVMAATRGRGFPTKLHPVLSDFNYFFIQLDVDGYKYLLDASEKNLDFGRLPYRALNTYARLMDFENGSSWIDIQPTDFSRLVINDSIKLNADGSATGQSSHQLTGYHALRYRNKLEKMSSRELFNQVSNHNEFTQAEDIEILNEEDNSKELKIKYELKKHSQKIGDKIYLNPFSFRFFEDNPFKESIRTYPIDFGFKDSYFYTANIKIPEGYGVKEIPRSKNLKLEGGAARLRFSGSQINEELIQIQCQITFPYPVYPPEYHDLLKQIFDHIQEVQTKTFIVLEENS
jgi:hypothetical protein